MKIFSRISTFIMIVVFLMPSIGLAITQLRISQINQFMADIKRGRIKSPETIEKRVNELKKGLNTRELASPLLEQMDETVAATLEKLAPKEEPEAPGKEEGQPIIEQPDVKEKAEEAKKQEEKRKQEEARAQEEQRKKQEQGKKAEEELTAQQQKSIIARITKNIEALKKSIADLNQDAPFNEAVLNTYQTNNDELNSLLTSLNKSDIAEFEKESLKQQINDALILNSNAARKRAWYSISTSNAAVAKEDIKTPELKSWIKALNTLKDLINKTDLGLAKDVENVIKRAQDKIQSTVKIEEAEVGEEEAKPAQPKKEETKPAQKLVTLDDIIQKKVLGPEMAKKANEILNADYTQAVKQGLDNLADDLTSFFSNITSNIVPATKTREQGKEITYERTEKVITPKSLTESEATKIIDRYYRSLTSYKNKKLIPETQIPPQPKKEEKPASEKRQAKLPEDNVFERYDQLIDRVPTSIFMLKGSNVTPKVYIPTGEILDILKFKVDAIVNPANSQLSHGAGLAKTIADAADAEAIRLKSQGKQPTKQTLAAWSLKNKPLETGQAKISSSFDIAKTTPIKYIVHTVGPNLPLNEKPTENVKQLLKNAWKNSLIKAASLSSDNSIKTIAFPSISTGIFNFPLGLAAKIAAQAVAEFINENPNTLNKIYIIGRNPDDQNPYINAFTDLKNSDLSK